MVPYLVIFTACLTPKKLRGWVKSALIKLLPEEFLALLDHLGQGAYLEATKKIKQQKVNFLKVGLLRTHQCYHKNNLHILRSMASSPISSHF